MAQLPGLRHLCGHSQPDFGEMTEVVLSQQRSRRFETHTLTSDLRNRFCRQETVPQVTC